MHGFRIGAVALTCVAGPALGQEAPSRNVIIVSSPGEREGAVEVGGDDIAGSGRPDLFQALARSAPGLSLQDAQNNPYQPNLVYRGFTLSPLQGQPQGLAAYLDGGRFNQPFGDTMQFDLLPEGDRPNRDYRCRSCIRTQRARWRAGRQHQDRAFGPRQIRIRECR